VADHVRAGDPQAGQDGQDVPGHQRERVGLDGLRLAGPSVAAQVGDDDLEPGLGQRRDLVPPQPSGVGEAVQQNHRTALAGDLELGADAAGVHSAHAFSSLARGLAS
jgi:hypothetical protein